MGDVLKKALRLILDNEEGSFLGKRFNDELKMAFLSAGSETPDNLEAVEHFDFGICKNGRGKIEGLKVKDKNIMIADVINALEGIDLPKQVKEFIPDLNQEDLDAALRLTTMILVSLENQTGITDLGDDT